MLAELATIDTHAAMAYTCSCSYSLYFMIQSVFEASAWKGEDLCKVCD